MAECAVSGAVPCAVAERSGAAEFLSGAGIGVYAFLWLYRTCLGAWLRFFPGNCLRGADYNRVGDHYLHYPSVGDDGQRAGGISVNCVGGDCAALFLVHNGVLVC